MVMRSVPALLSVLGLAALQGTRPARGPTDRGRDFLVSAQREDGSFAPNRFGKPYRRGITGLCVLALLGARDAAHAAAARKGLDWLAAHRKVRHMYAHAYATRALAEGTRRWPELRPAAAAAVRVILHSQNDNGGWGYAPDPESPRTETCMAAAMLEALHAAQLAGIDVPKATTDKALGFLDEQYVRRLRMFHNETYPSPSYGATGMATAALELWGRHDTAAVRGGLAWLARQSVKDSTANLRGKPFRGYMRGRFHFELAAHGRAFRLAKDPKLLARWLPRVRARLIAQQDAKGAWDGWFGKPYGTALVLLTLGD